MHARQTPPSYSIPLKKRSKKHTTISLRIESKKNKLHVAPAMWMQQFVRDEYYSALWHESRALPVLNDLQVAPTVATVASDTGTN